MISLYKKLAAIVVSTSMCLSFGFSNVASAESISDALVSINAISDTDVAYAKTNLFPDLEMNLVNAPESLGFTNDDVKNLSVGESFTISNIFGNDVTEVNDIMYFPVIADDDIIAILTLVKYNNDLSASIGKDFADELSDYLKSNDKAVALFSYNQNIMGIDTSSNVEMIFDSHQVEYSANAFPTDFSYIEVANDDNVLSNSTIYDLATTVDTTSLINTTINTDSIQATQSYNFLINYPIVYQGNYGICWAATVAAMVIYEVDSITNLTATGVCDAMGHSYTGGSVSDIINALNYYLPSTYVPTYYSYAMTKNQVKTIIDNDDPACMLSHDINNTNNGHATSLCGYSESGSTFQIRIMDSAYQCFKFSTYSSTNGYLFAFGNTQYKWDYTVRLLHNVS